MSHVHALWVEVEVVADPVMVETPSTAKSFGRVAESGLLHPPAKVAGGKSRPAGSNPALSANYYATVV